MTTLIDRGFALLNRATQTAAATTIRYIRDATVITDELKATVGSAEVAQVTSGDTAIIGREITIRVYRPDFVLDAAEIKPQRGDLIDWRPRPGVLCQLEVLPSATGPEAGEVDQRNDWLPLTAKFIKRTFE